MNNATVLLIITLVELAVKLEPQAEMLIDAAAKLAEHLKNKIEEVQKS